jgi:hypothetical protein
VVIFTITQNDPPIPVGGTVTQVLMSFSFILIGLFGGGIVLVLF